MRTLTEALGRDGQTYRLGLAPNGTTWARVRLTTGRWDFWRQIGRA